MAADERTVVHTEDAPKAVGPYSQAICAGGFLFSSGQIPIDPGSGSLVAGPIEEQTRRVMENLRAVLEAGGTNFGGVVRATIYLTNLSDFAKVNAVYASYFPSAPPARSTVQVAALPLGASIEIDLIAKVR
jgi:2-iminobutanoate/2-iminopropanoate deaminase